MPGIHNKKKIVQNRPKNESKQEKTEVKHKIQESTSPKGAERNNLNAKTRAIRSLNTQRNTEKKTQNSPKEN